ncbi:MAG: cadmium-translocating P-type ATPase [Clostridiales bacterium]|nr:cadmium-translocating P-type ATPase [Clostridiales bacterium]
MGKHVSEQSRHLKTKDEPQDFPEIDENDEESRGAKKAKRGFADCGSISFGGIAPVVFAAVLLAALSFLPAEGWMKCVAFLIPFVIAGFAILMDAIDKLIDRKYFEAEQITLIAAIVVFAIGFYTEAVLLLILFRVVRLLETFISERCGAALKALPEIKPDTANVETAEGVLNVEPDYVNVGDIIQVPAGERIPLDGIIVEGVTTVDTSAISGQARPWDVAAGYKVYSGCTNVTAPIRVRVTKSFEQSTAARLVRMSEKAAQFRSSQESFIRKFISVYTPSMLALALVLAVVVPMFNAEWLEMLRRAVIVLICACPSAAVISVSLAYIKSIGAAAKLGIFVKGEDCIESMAMAETMVFDKTGTITEGRYVITDVFPVNMTERELLTTAASAEVFSRHPIAYALREAVGIRSAKDMKVTQVEEIPGRGVSAIVGDELVYVGNTALLEEHGISCELPSRSGAAIHVAVDGKYCGHILVADRIRSGAFDALESLRVQGIKKMVLLTGDVLSVARPLASKLNFDMLRAELKPEDKLSALAYLMSNKGSKSSVAFVGDGYNDRALMERVDVGIAMGALGSEAAFMSADVLVMDRDIRKLPKAIGISKLASHISLENIAAGICVNLVATVLGAAGILSVTAAVIACFAVSAAVLINTLRLK